MSARPTILIVDDSRIARDALEALLTGQDYELVFAESGREALQITGAMRPDLILLDVMMPDVDGFETCRLLRAEKSTAEIPVVLVTALDDRSSRLQGFDAGADDYVVKPFDRAELLGRVRTILRLNRFRRLTEERERFQRMVELAPYGLVLANSAGTITFANSAFATLVGVLRPVALEGRTLRDMLSHEVPGAADLWLSNVLANEPRARTEARLVRDDSVEIPVELVAGDFLMGGERHVQLIVSDIRDRRRAEARLRQAALYDELTGLPNRTLLRDRVDQEIRRSLDDPDGHVAIAIVALDHFRLVNDELGPTIADRVLVAVGQRLVEAVGARATVARLGGDEFAVLLSAIRNEAEGAAIASRVHRAFSRPVELGDHEVRVTASVGLAVAEASATHPELLLRDANTALYHAKSNGRNRWVRFDDTLRDEAVGFVRTAMDLRAAVPDDQLFVAWQPIVQMSDGAVVGAEALVRWQHPERGVVSPGAFIPVAEETGMISPIGDRVLEVAIASLGRWLADGTVDDAFGISINISPHQFGTMGLVDRIKGLLEAHRVPPACVRLEITETVVIRNPERTLPIFAELKRLGIGLYLDDFGTGYSSMSYLTRLPLDVMKIDRSFVARAAEHAVEREVVRAIVGLTHALGLTPIAEGVETPEQLRLMTDLGCELAQGFHFARPLRERELLEAVRDGFGDRALG